MLTNLLQPGRIGGLEIRNRILMAPMGSNLAERDGRMGERIKCYYEARAAGGVGLIIVGVGAIAFPAGACNPNQVAISDDRFVPDLTDFTARIHTHGAKVAIQLQHAGKVAVRDMADGRPMWVPSEIPFKPGDLTRDLTPDEMQQFVSNLTQPGSKMLYHPMQKADIEELIRMFADAAERAQRAGFDGVELHAGHGYILSSFLSPVTNQRDDDYGGPLENRARLLVEVLRATKSRVGEDFPVWCRIDAKEFRMPGGITLEDAQRTAELAAEAGADAIHVSAYADSSSGIAFTDAPLVHAPCGFVDFAAAIKQRVDVPIIAVGRIEPEEGDALIGSGRADFIAMARKLLADPELPNKLAEDRAEDVRPCIYSYLCVAQIFLNQASCCAVNPASGREAEFALEVAARPRRVLVVGGGPAGLEAARIAALRGHDVTLCEQEGRLGGAAFYAGRVYEENGRLVEWLETQVRKGPITVRLGVTVTLALVEELAPDVTLVAVGGLCTGPDVPGIGRPMVVSGYGLYDPLAATGWRVVIVGGGSVGIEIAELLCRGERAVTIVEAGTHFGAEMAPPRRWRALHMLRECGAELIPSVSLVSIEEEGVVVVDEEGVERLLHAESVILAAGLRENHALAAELAASGHEVVELGDGTGAGYIRGAMMDAARAARAI